MGKIPNAKYIILFIGGTICAQNGTEIVLEFGCEEYGSAGICEGKITGDCQCVQPTGVTPTVSPTSTQSPTSTITPPTIVPTVPGYCVDGEEFCSSQCECGTGYYTCSNGVWILRDLPRIY